MSYNYWIEYDCVNLDWDTNECLLGENAKCSQRDKKDCDSLDEYSAIPERNYLELEMKLKNPVEEILAKYRAEGKVHTISEEEMNKARSEIEKKMNEQIPLSCLKFRSKNGRTK
jgi:hypothetical protein